MNRAVLVAILFLSGLVSRAQELNCQVIVNAEQTGEANAPVFKTLQNSLTEFINQTRWTNKEFTPQERINCSMFINISDYDTNSFSGTIQVQSSRPVFGSTMVSPVFNFNDQQFSFQYTEFEPLQYSPTEFRSNLISVVTFYVYTILGLDADTFQEQGGTPYYEKANQIVNVAQQGGNQGWKVTDGNKSRYRLNSDLLSNSYEGYRKALYDYHRQGLDLMHMSPAEGKKGVTTAILDLDRMNDRRPNSLLVRTFFDAKADEIENIFSGGPTVQIKEVVEALNSMAPTLNEKWGNIRF
ncbi:MAG: DUF4835 family protein [Salinimicrobium sp.]